MSHVRCERVTGHINALCVIKMCVGCEWVLSDRNGTAWRIHMRHARCESVRARMNVWVRYVTSSYIHVCSDSFTSDMTRSHATWLIPILHDSFMYDMTHLYMTRLIHLQYNSFSSKTHSYITRLIHVWHDSFVYAKTHSFTIQLILIKHDERWGAGVDTQKNVRGEIGGWGRVPFNETYAPSLSTIYDGA